MVVIHNTFACGLKMKLFDKTDAFQFPVSIAIRVFFLLFVMPYIGTFCRILCRIRYLFKIAFNW